MAATTTYERTNRFSGSCEACVYPIVRELADDHYADRAIFDCPGCGAEVKLERLYGEWSDTNCDARCQNALGPVCECACGGANHQSGYIPPTQTGEVSAHVLSAYRKRVATRKAGQEKAAATRRVTAEAKRAEREREQREATMSFIVDLPPEVVTVMQPDEMVTPSDDPLAVDMRSHDIIADMRARLWQYGSLSEKQVAFAARLIDQERQYRARKQAEAETTWIEAPEGRQTIEGVVLASKYVEGYRYQTLKMLVRVDTEAGAYKVWSTVPDVLQCRTMTDDEGNYAGQKGIERGDRVRFDAAITRSDDDPSFAFAKRPTKASYVEG